MRGSAKNRQRTSRRRRRPRMRPAGDLQKRAALTGALMLLEFINTDQIAQLLDVDPSTARRECERGILKGHAFKVGREWRVRPSALRELGGLKRAS
jgi:hypothetical protein